MSAESDLAAGLTPPQLVSGDLAALESMAADCRAFASELAAAHRGIGYIQVHGRHWTGHAADVYDAARHSHLGDLWAACGAFETAAGALDDYARVLRAARADAAVARREFHAAATAQVSCAAPSPLAVGATSGAAPSVLQTVAPVMALAPTKASAIARLEQARSDVHRAGLRAMLLLEEASKTAPEAGPSVRLPSLKHVLAGIVTDTVTAPYHLLHGFGRTMSAALLGLPSAMTPHSPGLPIYGPDTAATVRSGADEWGSGALGTAILLGGRDAATSVRALLRLSALEAGGRYPVPTVERLAEDLGRSLQQGMVRNKGGFTIKLACRRGTVVIRVMEGVSVRGAYYRVSVAGKEALTVDGVASTDRALTHIQITHRSLQDILRTVAKLRR